MSKGAQQKYRVGTKRAYTIAPSWKANSRMGISVRIDPSGPNQTITEFEPLQVEVTDSWKYRPVRSTGILACVPGQSCRRVSFKEEKHRQECLRYSATRLIARRYFSGRSVLRDIRTCHALLPQAASRRSRGRDP